MTWYDITRELVVKYCTEIGARTFTMNDFFEKHVDIIAKNKPNNHHIKAKVRQQLQLMRDNGILSFTNKRGTYTLRSIEILDNEIEIIDKSLLTKLPVEKKEHLFETYARDRGWVKLAKQKFDNYCMFENCQNTFLTAKNEPYIEVHHIIPLFQGGEDGIWNLSVLCAHHHKMAHFSDAKTIKAVQEYLLSVNYKILSP